MSSLNEMVGKEVIIYPGDTYKKKGIIKDITKEGVLFLITESHKYSTTYVVGALHFISFSSKLTFREVQSNHETNKI